MWSSFKYVYLHLRKVLSSRAAASQQPPSSVHPYRTHNHQSDIVPLFTPTSQRMQLLRVFFFFFILLQLAISWPYEWRKTKRERDRRLYHGEAAAHPPSIAAHCDAQSERVTTKPNCYVTDSLLQHHRRLTSAGCAALQCTPVCTTNSHMIRISNEERKDHFQTLHPSNDNEDNNIYKRTPRMANLLIYY